MAEISCNKSQREKPFHARESKRFIGKVSGVLVNCIGIDLLLFKAVDKFLRICRNFFCSLNELICAIKTSLPPGAELQKGEGGEQG